MSITPIPKVTSKWQHKNGNIYTVLLITNLATTKTDEYPATVVYCDEKFNFWSCPLSRWHGSMTLIPEEL